ncbi:hypothetical protein [Sphingobacterium faecale]|uniref:Uncharacterized protein n=1 Tax=Sphingobacterium faecale TaxID=2803775 RepID=A0ABS1R331_9SPHI|nr:hypothetical protein [Sphingobacterium faecale]MBL1408685.1 hypothetical protein [Sphingobacterium faecale]
MKKKDQNMGQVEARSTDKLGGLGTALGVLALALLLSSYTLYHKAEVSLTQTCYEYTGNDKPTSNAAEATNPGSYAAPTNSITCELNPETLCGFCFEGGDFELDEEGQPLFKYPETGLPTPLGEVVLANWNQPGMHNQPITASNNNVVTLQFRNLK